MSHDPTSEELSPAQRYYRLHAEARRESARKYRLSHPELVKYRCKQYFALHADSIREQGKKYRIANRPAILQKLKKYYRKRYDSDEQFRKNFAIRSKKWKADNPDKVKLIRKRYALNHPEEIKSANRIANLIRKARERGAKQDTRGVADFVKRVKARKYIRCYYCQRRVSTSECHFDHIVPISKQGQHAVWNLCVSCPACNMAKHDKMIQDWPVNGQRFLSF